MSGENLTREEAKERSETVTTNSYDIHLNLTKDSDIFRSTTTAKFSSREGASSFIDAHARTIHSITLNGQELDVASVSDAHRITLTSLAAENILTVVADFAYTNTGEGLHKFVDPVDNEVYLYSQFEVPDSRRVFTVFEQPDLKATFAFTVTAPADWLVISNATTPKPQLNEDKTNTWIFPKTAVMSSYITAVIAGPYSSVHSELTSTDGRTIPLGIFCRKSLSEFLDAEYIFEKTRQGFDFFENAFKFPYPFDKYDQLFVPEFNAGAMENAGAVTFTESYVFRSKVTDAVKERRVVTILHELAHMWFGDLVTMKWWNDLWLNESFAEWASTLATAEASEWKHAWTTFAVMEKTWAFKQDQLPSTHPIVANIRDLEDVLVNFDGITYAKGGSVLKQLVAWVGIDAFFDGVAAYFRKHAWGNTELSDLLHELETSSGRKLDEWSKLWLETSGVNTLIPRITLDPVGIITDFSIEQKRDSSAKILRPHRVAIGLYNDVSGKIVRTQRVECDIVGETTPIPQLHGEKLPAIVIVNDDDLSYAKIRFDDNSITNVMSRLSDIEDPLARALIWGSLWDAARDGEIPVQNFIHLALRHIGSESESTTLRTVLNQTILSLELYLDPAKHGAMKVMVQNKLWELAQHAKAGSDEQFQFVKFFAAVTSSTESSEKLSGLRSGKITLDGLTIDTDLDWDLLEGLVMASSANEKDIADALARDTTAKGQQAAARLRATISNAENKLKTLKYVIENNDLANAIIDNMALGFQHADDRQVFESVVEPYFESLLPMWEHRSHQIAESFVEGFYPAPLANIELLKATQRWLDAHESAPLALKRLVIENRAGTERAINAQKLSATSSPVSETNAVG